MSAPDIFANMARGWNRDPSGVALGTERSGVSAALWTHDQDDVQEVWAEPDSSVHILSIPQMSWQCEMFFDSRLAFSQMVRPNTATLIVSGERPRAVNRGPWSVLHFYIPTMLPERMAKESGLEAGSIELLDPECREPDPALERFSRELLSEMREGEPLSRLRIDLLGQDVTIHLLRHHSNLRGTRGLAQVPALGGLAPWQVRRVREYLAAHLEQDVSLGELAAIVGLSPAHFCRAHKQATGLSPLQSLTALRVERAKALLADPRLPVIEVAAACGYESPSAFAQVFRRETGVTPTQWRRRL